MIALLAAAEALVVTEARARRSRRAPLRRNRPASVRGGRAARWASTRAEVADLAADLLSSAGAQDSASEALSEASSELDALMETWAEDLGLKSTEELEEWIEDFESDEEVSDYSIDGPGTLGDD